MSGATTRKPASASAGIWWRHEYQYSGKPCRSTTSGPLPASTTWRRTAPRSTVRCSRSVGRVIVSRSAAGRASGRLDARDHPVAEGVDEQPVVLARALSVGGAEATQVLDEAVLVVADRAEDRVLGLEVDERLVARGVGHAVNLGRRAAEPSEQGEHLVGLGHPVPLEVARVRRELLHHLAVSVELAPPKPRVGACLER